LPRSSNERVKLQVRPREAVVHAIPVVSEARPFQHAVAAAVGGDGFELAVVVLAGEAEGLEDGRADGGDVPAEEAGFDLPDAGGAAGGGPGPGGVGAALLVGVEVAARRASAGVVELVVEEREVFEPVPLEDGVGARRVGVGDVLGLDQAVELVVGVEPLRLFVEVGVLEALEDAAVLLVVGERRDVVVQVVGAVPVLAGDRDEVVPRVVGVRSIGGLLAET
jgi:hypothetical protein